MATYRITAEVDEQWFEILGQITRHQEGFVWLGVGTGTRAPRKEKQIAQPMYDENGFMIVEEV